MSTPQPQTSRSETPPTNWRQVAWITLGAIVLYAGFRLAPTGTNLNHMDFRVSGPDVIDFCDPSNPQFIPVVAVRSPVTMTLTSKSGPPAAGQEGIWAVTLKTSSGKAIEPVDLLVTHTEKLHLLIVDPTLTDYQHVHPQPAGNGEWTFAFAPRGGGTYRVFGDFTPTATARGLYANADLVVAGPEAPGAGGGSEAAATDTVVERAGYRFALSPAAPVRAREPVDLLFTIHRPTGGEVPLEPVMGAFAHLVAFDETRSGFAHLHPAEADVSRLPDAARPRLSFKVTIPQAGRYVIWAQVKIEGEEVFVPFWFDVAA